MEDSKKALLKEKIYKDIKKLDKKIEELKDFTQPIEPDCAIGRISRMDAINNKTVFDASLRNSRKRKKELEHAIKLIEEKNYGLCFRCGAKIPFDRLIIRPEVRVCVECGKV
ncbi:MAG: TraR/DksA C4-type zinc finger protein [Bacteroidales bacterium]|nr:TraR/DksA C4-type zinc finger protein [Bacteroidales bacterium]